MRDLSGVLLATDLDGTLLGRDHAIPPGSAAAVSRFMRAGGRFTLATGRSLPGLAHVKPSVPVNAPAVLLNGALVYDYETEALLYGQPLSPEARALGDILHRRYPDLGLEIMTLRQKYAVCRNAQIDAHLAYVRCGAMDLETPGQAPADWYKLLAVDTPERLRPVGEWLKAEFGDRMQICYSASTLLEIQDMGVDKGAGVARVAELTGAREVYCAGDNENDLPMLRAFPSFAPANATDACKDAAMAVGPDCGEDFMAFVIERIENGPA
ncbi:MAG: HAD-IIB family hydrolase [Oscillospiraceae bacterium]|nr:HAD-IIB family hydrolase [Oscillospiraceae bacterium]